MGGVQLLPWLHSLIRAGTLHLPTRCAEASNELAEALADDVLFGGVVVVVMGLMVDVGELVAKRDEPELKDLVRVLLGLAKVDELKGIEENSTPAVVERNPPHLLGLPAHLDWRTFRGKERRWVLEHPGRQLEDDFPQGFDRAALCVADRFVGIDADRDDADRGSRVAKVSSQFKLKAGGGRVVPATVGCHSLPRVGGLASTDERAGPLRACDELLQRLFHPYGARGPAGLRITAELPASLLPFGRGTRVRGVADSRRTR